MIDIKPDPSEVISLLRHRTGLNQEEYAAKIEVSVRRIRAWERGEAPPPPEHIQEVELTAGEKARLLRRRLGLSIREAGELAGISHVTVIQAERNQSKLGGKLLRALEEYSTKETNVSV